jgi:hypothetical protein
LQDIRIQKSLLDQPNTALFGAAGVSGFEIDCLEGVFAAEKQTQPAPEFGAG